MSGIAVPNYITHYLGTTRAAEVTAADWAGGVNKGASNAPGIGINTGDYSPKASDWSEHARDPQNSQQLGEAAGPIITTPDGVNDQASFVQTIAVTANDAQVGTTGVFNRTGVSLASGVWFWGHKPIA